MYCHNNVNFYYIFFISFLNSDGKFIHCTGEIGINPLFLSTDSNALAPYPFYLKYPDIIILSTSPAIALPF